MCAMIPHESHNAFTPSGVPSTSDDGSYVYVLEFSNGTVKVGYTKNPRQRLTGLVKESARYGQTMTRHWVSVPHWNAWENEKVLIEFCASRFSEVIDSGSGEYFAEGDFDDVINFSNTLNFRVLSSSERKIHEEAAEKKGREMAQALMKAIGAYSHSDEYSTREAWDYVSKHGMMLHAKDFTSRSDFLRQQMHMMTVLQVIDFEKVYGVTCLKDARVYKFGKSNYEVRFANGDDKYYAPLNYVAACLDIDPVGLASMVEDSEYAVLWRANSEHGIYDTEYVSDSFVRRIAFSRGIANPERIT